MNTNSEVDHFLKKKNHLLTEGIQKVREVILKTDPKITEAIKWKSPTFIYKGNSASFFMNAKKFISLMCHKGTLIDDSRRRRQRGARRRFMDMDDIKEKRMPRCP